MNVEEFQSHLNSLSNLLRGAGGKKAADEFDEICAGLQPYRDRRLKDLLKLIADAETIVRTGTPIAKPARRSSKKPDPALAAQAIQRVRDLYNRATDSATTREDIEAACKALEEANASKPELDTLARECLIVEKLKSKPIAIARIQQAILLRKGTYQRAQI